MSEPQISGPEERSTIGCVLALYRAMVGPATGARPAGEVKPMGRKTYAAIVLAASAAIYGFAPFAGPRLFPG